MNKSFDFTASNNLTSIMASMNMTGFHDRSEISGSFSPALITLANSPVSSPRSPRYPSNPSMKWKMRKSKQMQKLEWMPFLANKDPVAESIGFEEFLGINFENNFPMLIHDFIK